MLCRCLRPTNDAVGPRWPGSTRRSRSSATAMTSRTVSPNRPATRSSRWATCRPRIGSGRCNGAVARRWAGSPRSRGRKRSTSIDSAEPWGSDARRRKPGTRPLPSDANNCHPSSRGSTPPSPARLVRSKRRSWATESDRGRHATASPGASCSLACSRRPGNSSSSARELSKRPVSTPCTRSTHHSRSRPRPPSRPTHRTPNSPLRFSRPPRWHQTCWDSSKAHRTTGPLTVGTRPTACRSSPATRTSIRSRLRTPTSSTSIVPSSTPLARACPDCPASSGGSTTTLPGARPPHSCR